ncbi:hypothetical protein O1611_g7540 [Lasiodiplodia mahajangana]|uniref:Uncharacterized protein n=1 Tax=Lasiodiplodia mahajangana TaxID=1108764 RepID=A0ACC2JFU4_9PEZI|nr:hypothetical protein O1611_g7540 [Lasiodiplodia mahajangana]
MSSPYSSLLLINNAGINWTPDNVPVFDVATRPHDKHPSITGLAMLVFEAVLEVICYSREARPFQTRTSEVRSEPEHVAIHAMKRATNFVTAMSVFGNSNSLPISLVISLSQTLKGLSWDRIQGDHSGLVSSRGILYLLIFQQLGQMVRWSWGFHVLLAKKEQYDEYRADSEEEGRYRDDDISGEVLIPGLDGSADSSDDETYVPAGRTPVAGTSGATPADSDDETDVPKKQSTTIIGDNGDAHNGPFVMPTNGLDDIMSFPRMRDLDELEASQGVKGFFTRSKLAVRRTSAQTKEKTSRLCRRTYSKLPRRVRSLLEKTTNFFSEFMNPPLWAMLLSIVVASIPSLQGLFFEKGSFVKNSVTDAITQSGSVAVPLILVVLGANLANNTKDSEVKDSEEAQIGSRLLIASLISRMVLPTLIMAPILALIAKYIPISILDDPIFIVVCFLLTGAPSALQLAQICQINEVYEGVMSKILFQSYVVWILPSTLILVMLALETLEWAGV